MSISRSVFPTMFMGCFGLTLAPSLQAQVPDCSNFKQEESHSSAPLKPIVPASKILHFCSTSRIPGQFIVKIKDNDDLAKDLASTVINQLEILPGLVPDTKEKCTSLGRALAERYHAKLRRFGRLNQWAGSCGTRGYGGNGMDYERAPSCTDRRPWQTYQIR
jgi:hypothetical protein